MNGRLSRRALSFTAGSLLLFAALAVLAVRQGTPRVDARILRLVPPSNEPDRLSALCNAFVVLGMVLGVALVLVVLAALIVGKRKRAALFWFAGFAGIVVLDLALKPTFERPAIADSSNGYSFPSGNGMGSMALLLATGTLIAAGRPRRLFFVLGGAVVVLYGAALVYISWHYPSDVVAGWMLSFAWITCLGALIRPNPIVDLGGPRGSFDLGRAVGRAGGD
jgi:membrane-associated phospholipid phosphatase